MPIERRFADVPGPESGMPSSVTSVCDSSSLLSETVTALLGSVASCVTLTPASWSRASVSEVESRRIGLSSAMSFEVIWMFALTLAMMRSDDASPDCGSACSDDASAIRRCTARSTSTSNSRERAPS